MARQNYIVAIYKCNRAYGGPEEGGWWYDMGELVKIIKVFKDEDRAYQYAYDIQRLLRILVNKKRPERDINSVLCEGMYCAEVHEGSPPTMYPETRPHYE
jgi:hypothetical protein